MKIINGTVFTEKDGFIKADLIIRDGIIADMIPEGNPEKKSNDTTSPADSSNGFCAAADAAGNIDRDETNFVESAHVAASMVSSQSEETIDAAGSYILPGLVDLHFHGCAGYDFCDGTPEAFAAIEHYELTHGITSLCPATMTYPEEKLAGILRAAAAYRSASPYKDTLLRGVNLEGPFVSEAKKGAQNPAYLMKPDAAMIRRLQEVSGGLVKLLDLAPELEGAMECIRALSPEMVLSVAHTTADYDTACAAFQAGASHVTHLYNAMPSFTHRAPGVIGAAADMGAEVELICDGIHIHPSVIRATFKLFGPDRMVLISDSMMATGMPDGQYALGGQPVTVHGHEARLADGTIAGSATNLYDCMVNAISFGIPAAQAITAASYNPARCIGISDHWGSIAVGKAADLLIADQDYHLQKVIKNGQYV